MLKRAAIVLALVLGALAATPFSATAAGGVVCAVLDARGDCKVWVPGDGSGSGSGSGGAGGGGSSSGGGESACFGSGGTEIPCSLGANAYWLASYGCYVDPASPASTDPTDGNPAWAGRTDGALYYCGSDISMAGVGIGSWLVWLPAPPTPGPNPYDLAMDAISSMNLRLGQVQTTPPLGGAPSIVGLPIWLWISDAGPSTTGPNTASASSAGVTVTATATLTRVEYQLTTSRRTMTVTCTGANAPGTPYSETYGGQNSPTCGFTAEQNDLTGAGTLTASAHWNVTWSGGGQAGTITLPAMSRNMPFEISELQVLRTDGG